VKEDDTLREKQMCKQKYDMRMEVGRLLRFFLSCFLCDIKSKHKTTLLISIVVDISLNASSGWI
jgi:hypothetical protein